MITSEIDKLILETDHLARAIAFNIWTKTPSLPKQDLEQAGRIGLIKAARRFDCTKNVRFTTYAYRYIYGEIQREIRDKWQFVKIKRKHYELKNKFKELEIKGETEDAIALALKIKKKEIRELRDSTSYSLVSLQEWDDESEGIEIEEIFIPELSGRTQDVFYAVCWLGKTTSCAIALKLGISSGTVRSYLIKLRKLDLVSKCDYWYTPNLDPVAIANIKSQILTSSREGFFRRN